jgi:hypothetical protein
MIEAVSASSWRGCEWAALRLTGKTFERKKDADAFHATVRVDVSRGDHIAPSKSETVAEAAERWIKRVEALGRERTTIRQYRQHINLHIAPRIGRRFCGLPMFEPMRLEAPRPAASHVGKMVAAGLSLRPCCCVLSSS